ncbi:hypothetical protein CAI21_11515 [Alkalilimnicola ehrlichii]|uniref:Copper chaperone PCu(A)C n=2 Tax=Alkalilimnicola ehrlichii TaxID=351052 RepID=A0A3E0WFY4_9GAMM|nr:hypothetical protein CAI21_11515 [Alkalilimnicola ehrlichii]RFA31852.1 hypothetical protein CAL65_21340 [Alkalilimnicola ehrlichii]
MPMMAAWADFAADSIQVSDPFARATPPGMENSAAYMTLRNPSDETFALVAAESTIAQTVELHTHLHEDGVMKMRKVEEIIVPAGDEIGLEPGGYHIMLLGLEHALAAGDDVPLTLIFNDGSRLDVTAEARHPSGHRRHGHGGGHHSH